MPYFFNHWTLLAGMLLAVQPVFAETFLDEDNDDVEARHGLPVVQDLAALGEESRRTGVPILLMFSTENCVHCERLEEEVLRPMRVSGVDPRQVLVRKVMLDEYETLRLFSGKKKDADRYAYRDQGVSVVPTVALVDANGKDLVPKIVGYSTPGIYENYLDEAIRVSSQLLKQR